MNRLLRHDAIAVADARRLCDPGVTGLCGPCRVAAQGRIYGYMLGGLGYALLGSSRAACGRPDLRDLSHDGGTVGSLAGGTRYDIADREPCACAVALLSPDPWLFKLSVLVRFGQRQQLVGFSGGRLTIIMSQLPSLFGVAGGGHNFFERTIGLQSTWRDQSARIGIGVAAILILLLGERFLRAGRLGLPW